MPRAVIVHHEVVHPQHTGVAHDRLLNVLHQLRTGALAQQGAQGVHDQPPARPEDEGCHGHAHDAVQPRPARQAADHGGDQHRASGQHVVAAVGGGGHQGLGADGAADGAVEAAHPELDEDGCGQHAHAQPAERHGGGVERLDHRLFEQGKADAQDGHADHQTGQIFIAGVAVGMLGIRGLGGQPEADEADHVGRSVREVVQSIRHDGDGAEQGACQQLAQAEQQVAGHAHTAGKVAVGRAGGRVLGIIGVPDEPADQELRHIYLSSPEVRSKNTT